MRVTGLLLWSTRFVVRRLLLPALILLALLGLTSGGAGSFSVSPAPSRIVSELQLHRRLPAGTTVSIGKKGDPLALHLDAQGRFVITTPRSTSLPGLLSSGVTSAQKLASAGKPDVAAGLASLTKP